MRYFGSAVECSDNQVTAVRKKDKDKEECWIAARQWVPRCQVGARIVSLRSIIACIDSSAEDFLPLLAVAIDVVEKDLREFPRLVEVVAILMTRSS
jgi:hypothetical protein